MVDLYKTKKTKPTFITVHKWREKSVKFHCKLFLNKRSCFICIYIYIYIYIYYYIIILYIYTIILLYYIYILLCYYIIIMYIYIKYILYTYKILTNFGSGYILLKFGKNLWDLVDLKCNLSLLTYDQQYLGRMFDYILMKIVFMNLCFYNTFTGGLWLDRF